MAQSLSWDGILCLRCRAILDNCFERKEAELNRRKLYRWHTITELQASTSCQLCDVALHALTTGDVEERHLWHSSLIKDLEEWNASLVIEVLNDFCLSIWAPMQDPRPESDFVNTANLRVEGFLEVCALAMDSYEAYFHCGQCFDGQNGTPFTVTTSKSTASDDTFARIAEWLTRCQHHESCQRWLETIRRDYTYTPARLIKINASPRGYDVNLVTNATPSETQIRYATLSHCWGSRQHGVGLGSSRLTTRNLEAWHTSIPWHVLPRTFRECIEVAHRLKIDYVWIDALCIIQSEDEASFAVKNDTFDWKKEALAMADIYSHAILNISATASDDSAGGLFRERDLRVRRSIVTRQSKHMDEQSDEQPKIILHDGNERFRDLESSAVARRAWILQERFLSPRVVDYAEDQVRWECQELRNLESLPSTWRQTRGLNTDLAKVELKTLTNDNLHQRWAAIVYQYSRGLLSFTSDRQIAILGLVRLFEQLLTSNGCHDAVYMYGLWQNKLVDGLCWMSWATDTHKNSIRQENVPSWSWLSLYCTVQYEYVDSSDCRDAVAEVVPLSMSINGETKTDSPAELLPLALKRNAKDLMEPTAEVLLVTARLCKAQVATRRPKGNRAWDNPVSHILLGTTMLESGKHIWLRHDDKYGPEWDEESDDTVYITLLKSESYSMVHPRSNGTRLRCLVLQATEEQSTFRRIAYFVTRIGQDEMSRFAEQSLWGQFCEENVPGSVCPRPNAEHMYTFKLV